MRKKLYDDVCGLYEPAFLRIDICEEFNFEAWEQNSPHQKAVFLHEYIHYLQDISTGYGLRNFSTVARELQGFIYKASLEHDVIHIPISLSDMDHAEENLLQREIYLGDHEFQKNKNLGL